MALPGIAAIALACSITNQTQHTPRFFRPLPEHHPQSRRRCLAHERIREQDACTTLAANRAAYSLGARSADLAGPANGVDAELPTALKALCCSPPSRRNARWATRITSSSRIGPSLRRRNSSKCWMDDMGCGLVSCLVLTWPPGADTEPVGRLKWPAGWGPVSSLVWVDASDFAFCAHVGARSTGWAS